MGEIEVVAHPPERRERSLVLACGGCGCGCSCCCCCCVHAAGGLIGAGVPSLVTLVRGAPTKASEKTYLRCKQCREVTAHGAEALRAGTVTCPRCGHVGVTPPLAASAAAEDEATRRALARSRRVAVGAFWALSVLLALVAAACGEAGLIALVLALPAFQLVAGLLSFAAIGVAPRTLVPSKKAACGAIGWVLLGLLIGTAIGGAVLAAILGVWSVAS